MGLGLDLTYRTVDYVFQLVHSDRGRKSLRAVKFFETAPIERIVEVGREPPDRHGTPADLIRLSRLHPWDPSQIDFASDRSGWRQISHWHRGLLSGIFRLFFLGDSDVTRWLEPIATGAPEPDEREYFSLQQEEEDRHRQFFKLVLQEVLDIRGNQAQLERRLRWRAIPSFNRSFAELGKAVGQLQDCRTLEQWVEAVTVYHMVAEAMVANRGTLVVEAILKLERYRGRNLLPGFMYGFDLVSAEESRHISGAVMALRRRIHERPELARVMLTTLARMAKPASGTNLPWLPKFPQLAQHMHRRLESSIGITPEATTILTALYPA